MESNNEKKTNMEVPIEYAAKCFWDKNFGAGSDMIYACKLSDYVVAITSYNSNSSEPLSIDVLFDNDKNSVYLNYVDNMDLHSSDELLDALKLKRVSVDYQISIDDIIKPIKSGAELYDKTIDITSMMQKK